MEEPEARISLTASLHRSNGTFETPISLETGDEQLTVDAKRCITVALKNFSEEIARTKLFQPTTNKNPPLTLGENTTFSTTIDWTEEVGSETLDKYDSLKVVAVVPGPVADVSELKAISKWNRGPDGPSTDKWDSCTATARMRDGVPMHSSTSTTENMHPVRETDVDLPDQSHPDTVSLDAEPISAEQIDIQVRLFSVDNRLTNLAPEADRNLDLRVETPEGEVVWCADTPDTKKAKSSTLRNTGTRLQSYTWEGPRVEDAFATYGELNVVVECNVPGYKMKRRVETVQKPVSESPLFS